jgi:hypothetical protein
MAVAVEHQQRVAAEQWLEDIHRSLAATEYLGVAGMHVAHGVGVAAEDVRPPADQPKREPVPPALRAGVERLKRLQGQAEGLDERRSGGAWWQCRGCGDVTREGALQRGSGGVHGDLLQRFSRPW